MKLYGKYLKFVVKLSPVYMPLRVLNAICTASIPYVTAYLSGLLVDNLIYKEMKQLIILALLTVGSVFGGKIIGTFLKVCSDYIGRKLEKECTRIIIEKEMEMKYADFVSEDMRHRIQILHTEQEMSGAGVVQMVDTICSFFQHLISVLGALMIFGELILSKATEVNSIGKFIDSKLTAVGLIFTILIISIIITKLIRKIGEAYYENIAEFYKSDRVVRFLDKTYIQQYSKGKEIRIMDEEKIIEKTYENPMNQSVLTSRKMSKAQGGRSGVANFLSSILSAAVIIYVSIKAMVGAIGIGRLVTYIQTSMLLCSSIQQMNVFWVSLKKMDVYLKEFWMIYDWKPTDRATELIRSVDTIEFKNVSFSYPGMKEEVLHNISFIIEKGECVAIVGLNGSGKTTLIQLLCRFYEPTSGQIMLNGINIMRYDIEEYRNILGVVLQNFQILSLRLGEVISCSEQYNHDNVRQALVKAGINKEWDVQQYLFQEFEGGGLEISGGEAQKIAIARALYKATKLLIFDEPTAALDPQSEYDVYSRMRENAAGRLTIFISHRLYSCKECDRIIVLDHGRIVQTGSHAQLLKYSEGIYAQMWNAQAKWYME